MDLSWPSVVDTMSGLGYYQLLVDGSVVGTSSATNATVSGLSTETAYAFSVIAVDDAGNRSAESPRTSAITLAPFPRPPAAVYARQVGTFGAYINWGRVPVRLLR